MSNETKSPGMRALEALESYVARHHVDLDELGTLGERVDIDLAAIIERETGVNELASELDEMCRQRADLYRMVEELRKQADKLAKALEEVIELAERANTHW